MTSSPRLPRRSTRLTSTTGRAIVALAVAALAVTACGSVSSPNTVATVNGATYSRADFDAVSKALLDAGQFTAAAGSKEIKTADARVVLKEIIRYEAFLQFIKDNDISIDPDIQSKVEQQAAADPQFQGYAAPLQDLLIKLTVAGATLQDVKTPSESTIEGLYDNKPASAGILCLSHILVKTESDARKVLTQLDGGAKFADVAKKTSTEPGADKSGGALKNGEEDCQSLDSLQQGFDRDFMTGAFDAKPGVPTGPVKSQFGYHIIYSHPFSEVKDSVMRVIGENAGPTLLQGFLSTSKVKVDSTYGRWNGAIAAIE